MAVICNEGKCGTGTQGEGVKGDSVCRPGEEPGRDRPSLRQGQAPGDWVSDSISELERWNGLYLVGHLVCGVL